MRITRIIEHKVWQHKLNGRTASIYGAGPWHGPNDPDKPNWELVTRGYTWELDNGTVGLGRVPAKTYEEAVELMEKFNNRAY